MIANLTGCKPKIRVEAEELRVRLPQGAAHELSPAQVGLPDSAGRRRVKGLHQQNVAVLASISPDYYTRQERGRRQASEPVLDTLARVLRLHNGERASMFELSGRDAARPSRRTTQKVQPQLQRPLDDLSTTPAVVPAEPGTPSHDRPCVLAS